ncbi:MAG: hypothetical protein HOV68_33730 [Streptomycetaceae bacterium]|nr:hypothetical protein [Streptomycetaceae bacterium]
MNAREAMRRRAAKALAEPVPDTSHAEAMTPDEIDQFIQAYTEAALGDAMAQAVYDRLAREAGMDERAIRRLEDGARPVTMPTLIRLGHALGGHFRVNLRSDHPIVTFEPTPAPTRRTTRPACATLPPAPARAGALLQGAVRPQARGTTTAKKVHGIRPSQRIKADA